MKSRPEKRVDFTADTAQRDMSLLFACRFFRMFAYGFVSVVLVLYLVSRGLSQAQVGLLLSLTLLGDTLISLWMSTTADRLGRRRMLQAGAVLMLLAGIVFAWTPNFHVLLIAAIIGVLSPSGHEVGPFLSIEQASLSQIVPAHRRTHIFAWYNMAGSFATALGALSGGAFSQILQDAGLTPGVSYQAVVLAYAMVGLILAGLFAIVSPAVETHTANTTSRASGRFGLHQSRNVVLRLSALFSLDAFAGGFVMQSIIAYWFHMRFGAEPATLGGIFFAANILAGISALLAARLAGRIGLIRTMVFTHLPSNILLFLVPLMPSLSLAVAVLLLRFTISQMDVPTRQSYVMAVVSPDERSAAAGITGVARSIGASISPMLTVPLLANPVLFSVPFFLAGGLKIIYDLILFHSYRSSERTS